MSEGLRERAHDLARDEGAAHGDHDTLGDELLDDHETLGDEVLDDHEAWAQRVRNETEHQRLDRNFLQLLQELRVAQTGVQILFAFLLTLVFQPRFTRLDRPELVLYGVTVTAAA